MSDNLEVAEIEPTEDEAMAAMLAGYNARALEAPAEAAPAPAPESNDVVVDEQSPSAEAQPDAPPAPEPEDLQTTVTSLKAEVKAIAKDHDPEVVRKLYGAIGDINRQLKELKPKQESAAPAAAPAPAPVVDEAAAAIEAAEAVAKDFPELAGPLVAAMKAVSNRHSAAPSLSAEEISALTQRAAQQATQLAAIEALAEEHPDYETARQTPEFQAWIATKPKEYQDRLWNTWNPAVVSRGLTEFKEAQKAPPLAQEQPQQQDRQKKQDRLRNAVVPRGTPAPATPSTPTEEELILAGYNKGNPRPVFKQR